MDIPIIPDGVEERRLCDDEPSLEKCPKVPGLPNWPDLGRYCHLEHLRRTQPEYDEPVDDIKNGCKRDRDRGGTMERPESMPAIVA